VSALMEDDIKRCTAGGKGACRQGEPGLGLEVPEAGHQPAGQGYPSGCKRGGVLIFTKRTQFGAPCCVPLLIGTHTYPPPRMSRTTACVPGTHGARAVSASGEWCASTKNSAGIRFSSLRSAANSRSPVAVPVKQAEDGGVQGQDLVDITLYGTLRPPFAEEFA
jgi:hypothetical protein